MNQVLKTKKGITLVALVIDIIKVTGESYITAGITSGGAND